MRAPLDLQQTAGRLIRHFLEICFWLGISLCLSSILIGLEKGWIALVLIGTTGFLLGLYSGFVEPYWLQTIHHPLLLSDGIKRSIRIIFLSDFHTGEEKTRRFYDRLFERVQALKPDLLLLGGDYVECHHSTIADLGNLARIKSRYGTRFVLGNHDYWDRPEAIHRALESFGAQSLTGRSETIGEGERAFTLVGIDDSWLGTPSGQLPLTKQSSPVILLTHESDILLDFPEGIVDLVFLGHTHGGQVRLPMHGSVKMLPQSTPQWLDRGLKYWRGMRLLISHGVGESGARVRFCARPQIVVVDL